jgi:hypothetical protein
MNTISFNIPPSYDFSKPETLVLNVAHAKPKEVLSLADALEADVRKHPASFGALPVVTGWNEIDPVKALDLLRRNLPGANRKIDPATILYYARQMIDAAWKATGQPVLVDSNGRLVDGQHRLYAIVISGVTVKSYVVTEVEAIDELFSFIDNSRPRNAATALQTAGLNGVSAVIVKVLKLAEELRQGIYNPAGSEKLPRLTPNEVLKLATRYPNAQVAARAATVDWSITNHPEFGRTRRHLIACFAMMVADLHDGDFDLAEEFFDAIMSDEERSKDDPIAALRKKLDDDAKNPSLKAPYIVGALIKGFNAWTKGETLKGRWMIQVDEDIPVLEAPTKEAAE